jgi:hypothetical protein
MNIQAYQYLSKLLVINVPWEGDLKTIQSDQLPVNRKILRRDEGD